MQQSLWEAAFTGQFDSEASVTAVSVVKSKYEKNSN